MGTKLNKQNNTSGFTLIEILIAMVVFAIIVTAMYGVLINSNRNYAIQNEVVDAQNNLRAAVGLLTRELRMAGYDPTSVAGSGFVAASAGSVHFTMDLNGNETIALNTDEDVVYELGGTDGTDLRRNNQVIAQNIQSIDFNYTLSDGSVTSTPTSVQLSQIRQVTVTVTAQTQNFDQREREATVTVQVRNM